ncbi:hypothetical protein [Mycobacterium sp.]
MHIPVWSVVATRLVSWPPVCCGSDQHQVAGNAGRADNMARHG